MDDAYTTPTSSILLERIRAALAADPPEQCPVEATRNDVAHYVELSRDEHAGFDVPREYRTLIALHVELDRRAKAVIVQPAARGKKREKDLDWMRRHGEAEAIKVLIDQALRRIYCLHIDSVIVYLAEWRFFVSRPNGGPLFAGKNELAETVD